MKNRQEFPGTSAFTDVRSKRRWRYRRGKFTVSLGTGYGSPEFIRRYEAACRGERLTGKARKTLVAKDCLSSHAERWLSSPEFNTLADATRATYLGEVKRLTERHGDVLAKSLDEDRIREMMAEKAATPSAANNMLRALRLVLEHARKTKRLKANPARGISMLPVGGDGFYSWTEEDISDFQQGHARGTTADLAMALMLYTGATRAEGVTLGLRNLHYREGKPRLRYQRRHAGERVAEVDIPVHQELWARLEPLMQRETFLQTRSGKPRSAAGLGNAMRKWCDDASLPECTSHGLRKACRRRLRDAGMREQEIAAVLGYADTTVAHTVIGMRDRVTLADTAIAALPP